MISVQLAPLVAAGFRREMPKTNGQLRTAADSGDLVRVASLLREGADPNETGGRGKSPLLLAVAHGNEAVVEMLLGAGADPCAHAPGKVSPLSMAISLGRLDLAIMILRALGGVPANCAGQALHVAISGGNSDAVQLLAAHGADLRAPVMSRGATPLEVARSWSDGAHSTTKPKYQRVVDLLLRLGAA